MKIIVLCGTMGSGKDTVASILERHGYVSMALADELKRLAMYLFSGITVESCFGPSETRNLTFRLSDDIMLEAVMRLADDPFGISEVGRITRGQMLRLFVEVMSLKLHQDVSVRWILQHLGTEWGRSIDQSLWITLLRRNIARLSGHGYTRKDGITDCYDHPGVDKVVVTDARFLNEVVGLRFVNGEVRQYWVDASKRIGASTSTHASEPKDDVRQFFSDAQVIDNNGTLQELEQKVLALL